MFFSISCPGNTLQTKECHFATSVKASHILVDSKEEADLIKLKLDRGENFETLAKKFSKCPSGENGGDLGFFERGQMVKEFEDAAFSMPVNSVSSPVKTQFGWHIIKVYDKK
ncbi:MAG: peptidyl-prolyl cis-trans isomerase [Candidatus Gastranaerophilales bacterium]|nr:peptidyl-prolyl cis-trans isomerase [Candidatus Gastranaerophilales bacterium]